MNPLTSFLQSIGSASALADLIRAHLENHLGAHPDNIGWSDVEEARRIESALREIKEYLLS
jgi:hypothetical protein